MSVIETQDLTKIYATGMRKGDLVALDCANIRIEPGEIYGLLGPNGAGKTTMFRLLLGLTHPTSGTATISGYKPSDPRSRQTVGYLPENHRFPTHLTGYGLLISAGRLYGLSGSEIGPRADELLEMVAMDKWRDTKISKYSKGMLQRIGLAQAMIADPEILLLDEPTDGVDPMGRVEIRKILTQIRDRGRTIVLNSHLLAEVEAVADRVAILQKGRVLKVSSVEALTSRKSQFEIEADMGSKHVDIPREAGRILGLTARGLLVELKDPEDINMIIDRLRMKQISIRSVKPMKVSLEQSFIEAITESEQGES
jgi:ABC-2 type transport system ATP-binding protein